MERLNNRDPRLRRTWPQRLFLALNVLMVMAALASAGMLAYADNTVSRIQRVSLGHVLNATPEFAASGPDRNVLVVGVDSADGLDPDDPATRGRGNTGLLSDTLMIVRVNATAREVSMLSIPRDLWVPIAPNWSYARINAALAFGGPDMLVETIQGYFNIAIHNYVEIDFRGFKQLVEAIDGVPVQLDTAVRDRRSGLAVSEPGCVVLDPDQALGYVRSRAYESFDGTRWVSDPRGDIGRIDRQQQFVQLALARAIDKGLRNPFTLDRLINVGLDSVTIDQSLGAQELATMGRQLRSFEPEDLHTYTLPVEDRVITKQQVLSLRIAQAQATLDVFRRPPSEGVEGTSDQDGRRIRVHILNGSGEQGLADLVAGQLETLDLDVMSIGNANSFDTAITTIEHAPGQEGSARLLAARLDPPAEVVEVADLADSALVLVIGFDHRAVDTAPGPVTPADVAAVAGGDVPAVTGDEGAESLTVAGQANAAATTIPALSPDQDANPSEDSALSCAG